MEHNPIDPARFLANIADLPIQQQIGLIKAHIRQTPTKRWIEFINHPAVGAWIRRNQKAINATMWGDNKP